MKNTLSFIEIRWCLLVEVLFTDRQSTYNKGTYSNQQSLKLVQFLAYPVYKLLRSIGFWLTLYTGWLMCWLVGPPCICASWVC